MVAQILSVNQLLLLKNARALNLVKYVRAVILDGDGVIFTGHVIEGRDGPLGKIRCHADGQGISLLRAAGIRIMCATGESGRHASFLVKLVEKWNSMPSVQNGSWQPVAVYTGVARSEKIKAAQEWLSLHGIAWSECAAMGDDMTDYDLLSYISSQGGFTAAPAQAEDIIKRIVHWIAPRSGGDGAVRDLANYILEGRNVDVTKLSIQ